MSAAAVDFRLYQSNALDVLAALLAQELRRAWPAQPLLKPDVIVVPQVAMRRWLQATLAERHGVAANLEFLAPGEFVARALVANLGPVDDDFGRAGLHWRCYAALTDAEVLAQPALAPWRAFLAAGDEALRPWTLAAELAAVFEKYQAWRRDWLLHWEDGADADDPQAALWRAIARGRDHRARRIQTYLERFEGAGRPLPQGLPPRLFVFAALNVSPDVLRVIATQARAGITHFYLPTPTGPYWGDLRTVAERLRAGEQDPLAAGAADNPLLQAWGAAGRDFLAVLGGYEVVHPSGEIAAFVDPEQDVRPTLAAGGLGDGLLHRLQSDLFHRRATSPRPLPGLRRDDPSLQLHAVHTRLRELQVLHDQLRGLLEDSRFDPPLQPRQIAVLAPDIDPYLPYLEAVFAAEEEEGDRIPYTVADGSPLAAEPLAEVFLHLLGLPLSRFGLHEILDLLASAPLAEAAGLEVAAFEQLRGWLHASGARWGLDAEHRQRHDAPEDDAFTWQFALDRLLLGHASGDDAQIAGVAPWPELEGRALDALDTLIRLLRVLSEQQRALADALPPAHWRERISGVLQALLPREPADPGSRRALSRLHALVDGFADEAARAGFDAPVPAAAVRAYFSAALRQADTRAPLLTGAVSFARMVPMRLLPFRVICLLGMNDGDFPRRDPGSGLNRLSAEWDTPRRRHGDRSLADDDRFLLLQLFSAAQDVLYLSWLGMDPADGSAREPSILVGELLDAAAAQHADPVAARAALVVRHPLQPFAPAAFGGDDPRRFSYRRAWQPAARASLGPRRPPSPWLAQPLSTPQALEAEMADLPTTRLARFLLDPADQFLKRRLRLRLADEPGREQDVEPLALPMRGLEGARLRQAIVTALLEADHADLPARLRAQALLPSNALARAQVHRQIAQARACVAAYLRWRGETAGQTRAYSVQIDGARLHGRVENVHDVIGIARVGVQAAGDTPLPGWRAAIRHGLDWLLANAAGDEMPLWCFPLDIGADAPEPLPPLPRATAIAALRRLLWLYRQGMQAPLPFAPACGWAIWSKRDQQADKRRRAAEAVWQGSGNGWAERDGDAIRLALRGRDPFADAAGYARLERNSMLIYSLLTTGRPADDDDIDEVTA